MRTFDLDFPQPSLAAWSIDARPVQFHASADEQPWAPAEADAFPVGLDDLFFGCSTATMVVVTLALACASLVA